MEVGDRVALKNNKNHTGFILRFKRNSVYQHMAPVIKWDSDGYILWTAEYDLVLINTYFSEDIPY